MLLLRKIIFSKQCKRRIPPTLCKIVCVMLIDTIKVKVDIKGATKL